MTIDPALRPYLATVADLSPQASLWGGPLALVDLDSAPGEAELTLPPCPVIGFGNQAHPLAPRLDCVVEPPVGLGGLVGQVLARPHAAAVVVGLLRLLPALDAQAGLEAESLAYAVLQGSAEHHDWIRAQPLRLAGAPGHVRTERNEGVLRIILDSPQTGNAIDRAMRDALYEALSLATLDQTIGRIVLSGEGRAFSLGAALEEFGTTGDPATAHAIRARTLPARMAARCAERLEARVQGACVGSGLELAGWARRIVATPDAWFQMPELAMGILPGAGGCVALTRRIGRQRTALLVLSGKRLSARKALDWGLVDEISADPDPADKG
jgi:enoyl-CoA hydratase